MPKTRVGNLVSSWFADRWFDKHPKMKLKRLCALVQVPIDLVSFLMLTRLRRSLTFETSKAVNLYRNYSYSGLDTKYSNALTSFKASDLRNVKLQVREDEAAIDTVMWTFVLYRLRFLFRNLLPFRVLCLPRMWKKRTRFIRSRQKFTYLLKLESKRTNLESFDI